MSIIPGFDGGKRVPPARSPIWEEVTLPLFHHLSSPRSIGDIIEWAAIRCQSHELVNNMLAWLSFTGRARYDDPSGCWIQGSNYESVSEAWGEHSSARAARMPQNREAGWRPDEAGAVPKSAQDRL